MLFITDTFNPLCMDGMIASGATVEFSEINSMEAMRLMTKSDWRSSFKTESIRTLASVALGFAASPDVQIQMFDGDKMIVAHMQSSDGTLGFILATVVS
jgi:hypothetical protein